MGGLPRWEGAQPVLRFAYFLALSALLTGFLVGVPLQYRWLSSGALGLSFTENRQGEVLLRPIPGQAADLAGVRTGDVLVGINEASLSRVEGLPGALRLMSGPPGTAIELRILSPQGQSRSLSIVREAFALETRGITAQQFALVVVAGGVLLVAGFSIPALIIASRKSTGRMAALVAVTLILFAVYNSRAAGWMFGPAEVRYVLAIATNLAVLLVLLLFPDGRFVPRWTRGFFVVSAGWIILRTLPTPVGIAMWAGRTRIILDAMVFGVGIGAQLYRYQRGTDAAARQQTRWLTFGFAVAFVAQYAYFLPLELIPRLAAPTVEGLSFQLVGSTAYHLVLLFVPVAFTRAVLHHRLFNIDLIVNRTLVYVPLSAILAGVYTASVILFRTLYTALTGESSDLAVVVSTLVIVAITTPLKDRLQSAVDNRFKDASQPGRILRNFELQVKERMHAVQAIPVMRRLAEQAAKAFGAPGGAALLESGGSQQIVHTCGQWSGRAEAQVAVRTAEANIGAIYLEPRGNGVSYSASELALLQEVADTVALAIQQDRSL